MRLLRRLAWHLNVCFCTSACLYLWIYLCQVSGPLSVQKSATINYLHNPVNMDGSTVFTGNFVVASDHCKIPEVFLWTNDTREMYKPYQEIDCFDRLLENSIGLTFVRKSHLVIDKTLLNSLNLTNQSVECCYQQILQPLLIPSKDNLENFMQKKTSNSCIPIKGPRVIPKSNSIKVTCSRLVRNGTKTKIHEDYHILANLLPGKGSLKRKIKFWKGKDEKPPSIFILGVDCGTRLNIRRQTPNTVKYLQDLGAVEMLGYNKVGPHTPNNLIPLLTSFHEAELEKSCNYTSSAVVDHCPFIFSDFSEANYVTNFLEDGNSLKFGSDAFLRPPTDFYHLPWMKYLRNVEFSDIAPYFCVEKKSIYKVMIDFGQNLAEQLASKGLPYFSFVYLGGVAHDDFNGAQHIDNYFKGSLQYLHSFNYLDNTIVILMGDHGYRWGKYRRSLPGWYEDKQPVMWIRIPPKLAHQRPDFQIALKTNANKLSSPFDLYQTLKHVISLTEGRPSERSSRGISFFTEFNDRNCDEAGILTGYCTCTVLLPFQDVERPLLMLAAESAISVRNFSVNSLPKDEHCEKLKIENVIAAAVMSESFQNLSDDQLEDLVISGRNNLVLGVNASIFEIHAFLEFIVKYDAELSPTPFEPLYFFDVGPNKVRKLPEMGYYKCRGINR